MPKKKGRKPRSTRRLHLQPTAAAAVQKPSKMSEAEEPRSPSPSRSRSRSPSLSQPLDPLPDQQHLEPKEESQGPPQETQAEMQEQPPQDVEEEESQGAPVSPPRPVLVAHDSRAPNASLQRRAPGKRAKPLSDKQRAAVQEKLDLLEKNLRPIAFAPGKAIDFPRHERLFRALGLWEFAHADLGGPIRADLLAQLIARYDPQGRRSWVNGARIVVSRPDLARALGLQTKKEKASLVENKGADQELFSCEDSVSMIMDFMSNWVLFHEEDACILPGEVVTAIQLVKEGQAQKVDWSGLIWIMVEKELLEVPTSGVCYYASHMQCLMKHQKPGIFDGGEQDVMEVPLAEEEEANDVAMATTSTLQDTGEPVTEKEDAESCLGLGGDGGILKDDILECQENEQDHWFHGTKNIDGEHYLQRCNLNDVHSMDSEDVVREEVGIGEQGHYGEDITAKFSNLEKLTSTDLLQVMNTGNVSYLPLHQMEPSSGEFLVSKPDPVKGMELDACMGGSSFFKMAGKREMDEVDDDDDDDDISRLSHGNHQKRIRTDGQWDQTSLTVDKCMDEAQAWMDKAKMLFSQRDQEVVSAQMHIEYVNNLLQQKDHEIQILEKTRLEEQHRRQMEICRFEHELCVMARIIQGYRKALMETRRAFAEYRKQFPQGDEQLYKDDDDGGGLVLSTKELKRKRLQKEEARRFALQMIDDFEGKWLEKFNDYDNHVQQLDKRLLDLTRESNALKERRAEVNVTDGKE
ncbi:hypothetical protein Taro_027180 [Colocasia esculenta]|uniref:Uncharacterized protein n=1 Tax=Colocasia esculenta TaxID=4460 RepID=A0A843VQW9_COLES|nr:hypothetical protein [Colocasia esculenta]